MYVDRGGEGGRGFISTGRSENGRQQGPPVCNAEARSGAQDTAGSRRKVRSSRRATSAPILIGAPSRAQIRTCSRERAIQQGGHSPPARREGRRDPGQPRNYASAAFVWGKRARDGSGGGTSVVGLLARRKRAKRESVRGGTRLSDGSCLFADNERWGTVQHIAITGTTRRPRPAPVARSRCRSAPSKTPPTQSRCRARLTASRRQSPAPAVPAHCRPRRATGC